MKKKKKKSELAKWVLEPVQTYDIFVESHEHAAIFALLLFPFFFELTHGFKSITILQPPILVNVLIDILNSFRAYPFRSRIGSNFVLLKTNEVKNGWYKIVEIIRDLRNRAR